MKSLLLAVRNIPLFNFLIRNPIRWLMRAGDFFRRKSSGFRIVGEVVLRMEGISIQCVCRADDFIANTIYYQGSIEGNEFRLIRHLTSAAGIYVDVGAYTGIFSLFVAKSNPSIQVYSIEPHPANYKRIVENVALNGIGNVRAFPLAVGSESGKVNFIRPADGALSLAGTVNEAFSKVFQPARSQTSLVDQVTLDDLLRDVTFGGTDLIKIDVEFNELKVLKGAQTILTKYHPLLLVEIILGERLAYYRPEIRETLDLGHSMEVESFLRQLGYHPHQILNDGIYRVDSIINCPDARDILFAAKSGADRFVPFEKVSSYFA